jgi:hypothetical protein
VAEPIQVRALRGVIVGCPGRGLDAGEVAAVAPLDAALLIDIGAAVLVRAGDRPHLDEALGRELRRQAAQRPRFT